MKILKLIKIFKNRKRIIDILTINKKKIQLLGSALKIYRSYSIILDTDTDIEIDYSKLINRRSNLNKSFFYRMVQSTNLEQRKVISR